MFKALAGQVQRLFSSKHNSGRLVYRLTDKLHYYKQVLIAASIVLLLGYSQFRAHFQCQGSDQIDSGVLTNICWINGTTTLDLKDDMVPRIQRDQQVASGDWLVSQLVPHVGIHFGMNDGRYELINHNYMRSLWALLILMATCSFMAQRSWSSLFQHDVLQALLKLPGSDELALVRRVQEARPYENLIKLPPCNGAATPQKPASEATKSADGPLAELFKGSQMFHSTIDILTGEENEYNHTLDYYPNQLIYLLMAKRTAAYRLAGLNLKRRLICHSIYSFLLTSMQFILPLMFIGHNYKLYGWRYFKAWFRYELSQLTHPHSRANSVDYELSARIWPTSTSCQYSQYAFQNQESITVQCTVPINEICAKLFMVIWWFVAINIAIELISLTALLTCAFNFQTTKWTFGRRFWPHAKKQANAIATFRYRHAIMLRKQIYCANRTLSMASVMVDSGDGELGTIGTNKYKGAPVSKPEEVEPLNESEKKKLEAERDKIASSGSIRAKKWYLWCSRDVGMFLTKQAERLKEAGHMNKMRKAKHRTSKDEEGFREVKEDSSLYFLLYLLYARLGCSRKKVEQVIKMTSKALDKYLENMNQLGELKQESN